MDKPAFLVMLYALTAHIMPVAQAATVTRTERRQLEELTGKLRVAHSVPSDFVLYESTASIEVAQKRTL